VRRFRIPGRTAWIIRASPKNSTSNHRPRLEGLAGDDLDMFLTYDAGGATGVSGFIS
jgi:hypothetical protein